MNILSILELFGGVGLFLFGMSLMGQSLEKLAGSGLEKLLETLTTSKKKGVGAIKGWALGLGVTGVIQSSAATTIMLIGFVNAGIMKVSQTIPVVMGSNIGSTVTAQILRLGDLGSGSIVLQLLKPSSFAPMLLAIGAFIHMSKSKRKTKDFAGILIGLGTLFYGMTMMEEVFAPLKESPKFQSFFTSFENPFLGIMTGLVLTALIQSSSASVGILQALSATGSVTYGIAVPMIIGQNIGKCMTIILGSVGSNKKAKRVAASYLIFNIFGAVLFSAIIYGIYYTVGIPMFSETVNRGDIANIHLAFNLLTSIILLPFSNQLSKLTGVMLKDEDIDPHEKDFMALDDMLLSTPGIALNQCVKLITKMAEKILENYYLTVGLIVNYKEKDFLLLLENEAFIDKCETKLTDYVMRIDRKRLTPDNKLVVTEILNSISDFESIGDYCVNIAYIASDKAEGKVKFSVYGENELSSIISATKYTMDTVFKAFTRDDLKKATRVEPLADTVKEMKEIIKNNHLERLESGKCTVEGGIALFDLANSCERITSHAANISLHVIKRLMGDKHFDEMHGHSTDTHSEEFKAMKEYYYSKFISPIISKSS